MGNSFNGKIDEVRIHRRALSPEEIKASYGAEIYRLYRNFTDLAVDLTITGLMHKMCRGI